MKITQEQKNILDCIVNSKNNIGIEAGAGCGKTSTLLMSLKKLHKSKSVKFFAFSNVIADELKKKVSSLVQVSTIHATGLSVLKNNYKRVSISETKIHGFVSKYVKTKAEIVKTGKFKKAVSEFIPKHSLTLMDFSDKSMDITYNKYSFNFCPSWYPYIRDIKSKIDDYNTKNLGKSIKVDFTDMVTLPISMNLEFPKYDVVFFDEAQDMGECHRQILLRSVKHDGRFIVVFDRRQNIFSFAGADINVLNNLLDSYNAEIFPLSYSFRCGKEIVGHSLGVFGDFKAHHTNIDGEVANGSINEIKVSGDAVLCRNTKPLFDVWAHLASNGISSFIKGKEFGLELIKLLKKYRKENNYTTSISLDNYLQSIEEDLFEIGVAKPKFTKKYIDEYEKVTILRKLLKNTKNVAEAIKKLTTVFTEKGKGIPLMTIHKSKGLEFERVFVMRNDLIPSRFCVTKEDFAEERRLDWVLRTRAKKSLIYICDFVGDVKPEQVNLKNLHKNAHNWS
jgi:superfamily I DNA/RNA helicase